MKITILSGHTEAKSFIGSIVCAYAEHARKTGHEVWVQNPGEMHIERIFRQVSNEIHFLEPDLMETLQNVFWCNKCLIIYPFCPGSLPALLKSFLDRTILPLFAFKDNFIEPYLDKLPKAVRSGRILQAVIHYSVFQ